MVRKLIHWAVNQPLVVLLLAVALAAAGGYAFLHINVEAYPDPAPPLMEVVAQYPGASAEEIERRVTVPLETALAGMPGLTSLRSKSLYGLSDVRQPVRLRGRLLGGPARGDQPSAVRAEPAAGGRSADLAGKSHGRNLPLLAGLAQGRRWGATSTRSTI